ncbi:MAG: biotin synthase BioB [Lachnospiraceae bacterium]|nr:biotin synthase BioB [Lachnospiraceae bacterium]
MDFIQLAEEIIKGRRLQRTEDLTELFTGDLEALSLGADRIRQVLCGNRAELCSIVNGRSGRCSENCKFCAQSAHHPTDCETYDFPEADEFVTGCGNMSRLGVDRYSIVTSGRAVEGDALEKSVRAYTAMHTRYPDMKLCASHGLMTVQDMARLKAAGVSMYHTNVETSRRFFPHICTSHTYEDKLAQIRRAREAGLEVCSGGILGMGESWQDRADMALMLAELEVRSIPLNFLLPIPGTPLADQPLLSTDEIRRIVALFRYCNPEAYIRIAAGRIRFGDGGLALFTSGANATLTGDMLTTTGNHTMQDWMLLAGLGYALKEKAV